MNKNNYKVQNNQQEKKNFLIRITKKSQNKQCAHKRGTTYIVKDNSQLQGKKSKSRK